MIRRARWAAVVVAAAVLVAACSSGGGSGDVRQQRADELVALFDESWVPAGATSFERITTADRCGADCGPPGVSFSYVCTCDDLTGILTGLRDRLTAAGWQAVQGSPADGFLRFTRTYATSPARQAELSVLTWADAVEMQPNNAELQRLGAGRRAIGFGLTAS